MMFVGDLPWSPTKRPWNLCASTVLRSQRRRPNSTAMETRHLRRLSQTNRNRHRRRLLRQPTRTQHDHPRNLIPQPGRTTTHPNHRQLLHLIHRPTPTRNQTRRV